MNLAGDRHVRICARSNLGVPAINWGGRKAAPWRRWSGRRLRSFGATLRGEAMRLPVSWALVPNQKEVP